MAKNQRSEAIKKIQKGSASLQERKAQIMKDIKDRREAKRHEGEEWQDVDEHEKEVFATTGYFDVPEEEALISKADQNLLQQMNSEPTQIEGVEGGNNLADIIMMKLATGDFQDGDNMDAEKEIQKSNLDPKVIEAYKKVGLVMRSFKSGKLPKAFKIIPQTQNWEELLFLTNPEMWSPHSSFEATKIFASNFNAKLVQRFYSIILLPNV